MKEAANALLKVLEEPPEFATLFLLAENSNALLPTIRSRCITLRLAPLTAEEIGQDLALRTEWTAAQKMLVARLCGGAVGRARSFDLNGYLTARKDALLLLTTALGENDHSALFRATEAYRAGGEGKAKTDLLISVLYSILEDLMFLKAGSLELMRNQDMQTRAGRHCRAGKFRLDCARQRRPGRGAERNAPQPVALTLAGRVLQLD